MRHARLGLVLSAVAVGLIVPSSASAQVDSVSVSDATLETPNLLTLRIEVTCDAGWGFVASGTVTQERGKREASGESIPPHPEGVSRCTGSPQTVGLIIGSFVSGQWKLGKATLSGTVTAFRFFSTEIVPFSFGPEVFQIKKFS
jgi:hypothetical protein